MAQFLNDTFTDTAATTLTSHTGETGATWTEHASFTTGEGVISDANRLRSNSANQLIAVASGTPAGADYTVTATLQVLSALARAGLVARFNATAPAAGYKLWHRDFQGWQLFRTVGGGDTQVGSTIGPTSMSVGTYTLSLQVETTDGSTVTVTCKLQRSSDGHWLGTGGTFGAGETAFITYADTNAGRITATGLAGVVFLGAATDSTGLHLDAIEANDAGGGDVTAPVLTSPVGTETGDTTATIGATTDEGNGTMYGVVTTNVTQPSVAQIKAGQDHTGAAAAFDDSQVITTTGAKTFNATGLTASTAYYAHLVHTDAATNDSNRVTSAEFTTDATPADPLTAGTASLVSSGPGGISVISTDATSGSAPYTYQWERNEDGGSYSDLAGETALACDDTTATTPGVLYRFRCKQTDDVAATVTTNAVAAEAYSGGTIGGGSGSIFQSSVIRGAS